MKKRLQCSKGEAVMFGLWMAAPEQAANGQSAGVCEGQ